MLQFTNHNTSILIYVIYFYTEYIPVPAIHYNLFFLSIHNSLKLSITRETFLQGFTESTIAEMYTKNLAVSHRIRILVVVSVYKSYSPISKLTPTTPYTRVPAVQLLTKSQSGFDGCFFFVCMLWSTPFCEFARMSEKVYVLSLVNVLTRKPSVVHHNSLLYSHHSIE